GDRIHVLKMRLAVDGSDAEGAAIERGRQVHREVRERGTSRLGRFEGIGVRCARRETRGGEGGERGGAVGANAEHGHLWGRRGSCRNFPVPSAAVSFPSWNEGLPRWTGGPPSY